MTARIRAEVARLAGGAPRPRRARYAAVAAGLLAAAAAITVVVRTAEPPLLRTELAALMDAEQREPLRKSRGGESELGQLLMAAEEAIDAGRWRRERAPRVTGCTPEEKAREGYFDERGRLRFLGVSTTAALELHFYDEAGSELFASRYDRATGRNVDAPPLGRDSALRALERPACGVERQGP